MIKEYNPMIDYLNIIIVKSNIVLLPLKAYGYCRYVFCEILTKGITFGIT